MNPINPTNSINTSDTIAAVSTPLGEGAITIVRMSGPDSIKIAERLFKPFFGKTKLFSSHTVHYGAIKDVRARRGEADEVLLTVMRGPKTYTREDIVEINCHGGVMPVKRVLELCLFCGARLSEPGEFTKRAFLNGRIDLAQAEAVLDVIKAETDALQESAESQLKGGLSEIVKKFREDILEILVLIESRIDFSGDSIEFAEKKKIAECVGKLNHSIEKLKKTWTRGMLIRNGISAVICGKPNVGKSSLMNALLKQDRVIVTPIAGTTRDIVEENINIAGIKVKLSDTAGIIKTKDKIEAEGIRRSHEKLKEADIVLFVLDSSLDILDEDRAVFGAVKDRNMIIVLNKCDLPKGLAKKDIEKTFRKKVVKVSALRKTGLDELEDAIEEEISSRGGKVSKGPLITNTRHMELLRKASTGLSRAEKLLSENDYNDELLAADLNEAAYHLGLIIGAEIGNDVLDRIFARFCVGK